MGRKGTTPRSGGAVGSGQSTRRSGDGTRAGRAHRHAALTLEALCDTFVPAVDSDTGDEVERQFMARAASELGVAAQIEGLMGDVMTPDEIAGFAGLLDALDAEGFAGADVDARTARDPRLRRGPRGQARPARVQGPDAAVLLRPARRERQQPQLGGDRLPGPQGPAAQRRAGAQDDHGRRGLG